MENNSSDLEYIIQKARIGLTSTHLSSLSEIYNQIISEDVVSSVYGEIDALPSRDFLTAEEIRLHWQEGHSDSFLNQVDNIIYKFLGEEKSVSEIQQEFVEGANNFPLAANNLYNVWLNEYSSPTILDDQLKNLFEDPSNSEFNNQVHYIINKANCALLLMDKANSVISEVELAVNSTENTEKQSHLDDAKNFYHEFHHFNYMFNDGYNNECVLDSLIYPSVSEKINNLYNAVSLGKEIETSLLGVDNELM